MDANIHEIREIALSDYPITLRNMKSPPPKMYVRGRFPAPRGHKYVCIIGSRKWTPYGRDAVNKIISGLRGQPVSIVSGLAIGIDSIAHMAALEAGLHCIAFPGSSLEWDKIYPPSHLSLARRIVDNGGALLSRWDGNYPMGRWAFPARNVLMAGISHATIVIEADKRSGSLMTAKHAEELSREVMAVPGQIHNSQSYGPHMLIRRGAALISSSNDVLDELGLPRGDSELLMKVDREERQKKLEHKDPLAATILKMLIKEDQTIDEVFDKAGVPIQTLNEKVTILELEGMISVDRGVMKIKDEFGLRV